MKDRIEGHRATESIERAIRIRAEEIKKKEIKKEFQKTLTANQQGEKAKALKASKEVLQRYAAEEGRERSLARDSKRKGPAEHKKSNEKSHKAHDSRTNHDTKQAKNFEHKSDNIVLDLAVQRRYQHEQDSGEFGGSSGGDFFQQAVSVGVSIHQMESITQAHPTEIPEEVLSYIVDQVYVGVNTKGMSQFVIDFKAGVLNGGRMQIASKGEDIQLRFSGLDEASRRLLKY